MASTTPSPAEQQSTIEKIKAHARTLFMEKGYASTTVRDIVSAAGINLALLNYYFRSKEKLFELVMRENIDKLFAVVLPILNDEQTALGHKLELLAAAYTDMILSDLNLPIFVLNELQQAPERFAEQISMNTAIMQSCYVKQLAQADPLTPPLQHLISYLGILLFPFFIRPVIKSSGDLPDEHFRSVMEQRKLLAPKWMAEILGL